MQYVERSRRAAASVARLVPAFVHRAEDRAHQLPPGRVDRGTMGERARVVGDVAQAIAIGLEEPGGLVARVVVGDQLDERHRSSPQANE